MKIEVYAASERSKNILTKMLKSKGYNEDVEYLCKDILPTDVIRHSIDNNFRIITEDWFFEDVYEGMSMIDWCEENNVNVAQLSNNVYLIKDLAVIRDDDKILEVLFK